MPEATDLEAPYDAAFVLPADVAMIPVADLAPRLRAQIQYDSSDVAIMRPRLRRPCRLVSADLASLVSAFRTPTRIADAIVSFSRERQRDPEEVLDVAFEALQALVNSRVLVLADTRDATRIEPLWAVGQEVAGYEIVRPVQVLEDSELYQARTLDGCTVALKTLRPGYTADRAEQIEREAAILQRLNGVCSPRFVDKETFRGQPFLASEWRSGKKVSTVAAELRTSPRIDRRADLLRLSRSVIRAYRLLHEANVIHADVHAGNCIVNSDGTVTIVDYGLSRLLEPGSLYCDAPRTSVAWFYEPEAAAALLATGVPTTATFLGEQYALATLVYHILTGAYPVESLAEERLVLGQIAEGRLLPFTARGTEAWPELEAVLAVALHSDPARRFESVGAFLDAMERVRPQGLPVGRDRVPPAGLRSPVDEMLERVCFGGSLFRTGVTRSPRSSMMFGAAGIAWFLYRVAQTRGASHLLALGDAWALRTDVEVPDAFLDPELGVTSATVGAVSPYHSASGVHCVRALLGHCSADVAGHVTNTGEFLRSSTPLSLRMDLALGVGGQLVAASLLLDTMRGESPRDPDPLAETRHRLVSFARESLAAVAQFVGKRERMAEFPEFPSLGIAHGWAGLLYSVMRICRSADLAIPSWVEPLLGQLMAHSRPMGRGIAWPTAIDIGCESQPAVDFVPGWCRGSAGHVHLWTLAHEVFGHPQHLELAIGSAWHCWEHPDAGADLCCGLAGRAFGMLALYRHTGEPEWLERSRALAACAANAPEAGFQRPMSLYRGRLGVAVLSAELEQPEWATMPFFGIEGWPSVETAPRARRR